MSQSLILTKALSSACWEKNENRNDRRGGEGRGGEREASRGFSLRAGARHALLPVLGGIFAAIRCN
jgi:hypothetical protein